MAGGSTCTPTTISVCGSRLQRLTRTLHNTHMNGLCGQRALERVACNNISTDALLAMGALYHGKQTAIQRMLGLRFRVKCSPSSPMHPLAATEAMGAVDAELKHVAFQALVYHGQVRYIADMHMVGHLFRYARYTWHKSNYICPEQSMFTRNQEANVALMWQMFWRWLVKLTLISHFCGGFFIPSSL